MVSIIGLNGSIRLPMVSIFGLNGGIPSQWYLLLVLMVVFPPNGIYYWS